MALLGPARKTVNGINNNSQVGVKAEAGAKDVVVVEDEELNQYKLTPRQVEEEQTRLLKKLKRKIKIIIIRRSVA